MRIRVDMNEETRQRVEDYAKEHGLRIPRAYDELIREGLFMVEERDEIRKAILHGDTDDLITSQPDTDEDQEEDDE